MCKNIICLLLSVLLIVFAFSACGSKDSKGGTVNELTTGDENVSINNGAVAKVDASDNIKIETGYGKASDIKIGSENGASEGKVTTLGKEAQIFTSGKFYIDAVIYTNDEEGMPTVLACDGKNLQANITVSGISLSLLVLDSESYILDTKNKNYMKISASLLTALGMDTNSLSDISSISGNEVAQDMSNAKETDVTINGQAGKGVRVESKDGGYTMLYSVGDKLIEADSYDSNGKLTMQIAFNSVSDTIPSDMLTLKGYNQTSSISSFVSTMAKSIGAD